MSDVIYKFSTDRRRISNQIDHIATKSRFIRGSEISLERDEHLIVTFLRGRGG